MAPGVIETDMSREVRELAGDQALDRILLRRYGTPAEVASVVCFLASRYGEYINGEIIHVDGGFKMGESLRPIEEKMNTDTIYPKVREIVADVLAFDESEIERDGSLVNDYSAESIDFLDLVYQLEREFKIKIPRGMIEQEVRQGVADGEFEEHGRLTDKGLAQLKEYLSEVPDDRFVPQMQVTLIPTLFTVETFCKIVLREQERGGQAEAT